MVATLALNPFATTNSPGSFNISTNGLIQGTAYDSPNSRYNLAGGTLSVNETLPMWGGVGIYEATPGLPTGPRPELGGVISRATSVTPRAVGELLGFSVFDQAYHGIISVGNPVPLIPSYGSVHFYRIGSGARVAVACSPNLVAGGSTNQQVSWDFTNQTLEPFASGTVSSGTYSSGTGAVSLTTSAAHGLLPGDTFVLSAMTGTGAFATLNGTQTATAGTTGTTLNFNAPTGQTMTITGGTLGSGGAIPSVKLLEVQIGNSMTVNYAAGLTSWNRAGSCAVILL
jgi:hypothetical protein